MNLREWDDDDRLEANPDGTVTLVTASGNRHTYDPTSLPVVNGLSRHWAQRDLNDVGLYL